MPRLSPRLQTLAHYVGAIVVCLVVLGVVFDMRAEARRWPYAYRGDTMFYQLVTKNLIEQGRSYLDVPLLGAPHMLDLRDVAMSDNALHILVLAAFGLTARQYPLALNNFFLLSFVLVFATAFWVLRQFGVGWGVAVCAGLLYTFLPYHLARGEHHLFLTAYWQVPLAILVALWVGRGELSLDGAGRPRWRSRRVWLSVAIAAALGVTGFYYAFFACFFLAVAAGMAAIRQKSWRALGPGIALASLAGIVTIASLLPSVTLFRQEGTTVAVQRIASDADAYGLRIAQLLLPARGHRVKWFADLKAEYTRRPLVNENDDVALGIVGAAGFLGLLWWLVVRKPGVGGWNEPGRTGLLHHLSIFNALGVLLATMGGFGSLVAFFGVPHVRAYNRISVFIAFFAFASVALWVDAMMRRRATTRMRAAIAGGIVAAVTVLALYDQITPTSLPAYTVARSQFAADSSFVQIIEQNVPQGALIFQLPFTPFPEGPPIPGMPDYDLLRGYLHSEHLRWSYGTVPGREENAWLRQTAALPPNALVERLAWAGFSGIYIARHGYADHGAKVEDALRATLGILPIPSPDEQFAFYALANYRAKREEATPREQWAARREAALNPPLALWREGFSDQEEAAETAWRWGGANARMTLVNRTARPQRVRLAFSVTPNVGGTVLIGSQLFEPIRVARNGPPIDKVLVLPPGHHDVQFASDAPRAFPPNDFRELVFGVQNFSLTAIEG